ncbi:MAG TPA: CHASE domain-containing protein [Candidatus Saccharimonadales bacterium]|nr:CHASE domain-containing protein [Candidatus Saccharimonadales bacterium]
MDTQSGRADLVLRENGVLVVTFVGRITSAIVEQLLRDLAQKSKELRAAGKPVYILIDINHITGHTSLARSTAKEATKLDFDRGASFGGNLALGMLMQYLQRSISPTKARYYRRESDALRWLFEGVDTGSTHTMRTTLVRLFLPLLLLAAVLAATLASFYSTRADIAGDAATLLQQEADVSQADIEQQMGIYVRTLYDFKGLFAASDTVTRSEFETYFLASHLASDYPSLSGISFVRYVKDSEKNAYIARVRHDTSLNPKGYPNFTITPAATNQSYAVLEYIAPNNNASTSFGFDLYSSPERKTTLEKADNTGVATASDTVSLINNADKKGFIVSVALYHGTPQSLAQRQAALIGYVNAVFDYQKVFAEAFTGVKDSSLRITVRDASKNPIFMRTGKATGPLRTQTRTLVIAGKPFTVSLGAPVTYGAARTTLQQPATILSGGLLTAALLVVVMSLMLRSRRRAIELADAMTEDLAYERNHAIAVKEQLTVAEAALVREKQSVERKVIERTHELAEAQGRLLAGIQGLPFGFAVIDAADNVALANQAFMTIAGHGVVMGTAEALQRMTADFSGDIDPIGLGS